MLELDRHQGRYGEHFAQLVVTAAGYTCYKPDDTGDGVDLVITHTQHDGTTPRPPNVELQVKTLRDATMVGNEISYPMEIGQYNALRAPGPTFRYLVVVLVPGSEFRHWCGRGDKFTVFREAAYWRSLLNEPSTTNTSSIAVRVPLANRYTPRIVEEHMAAARDQQNAVFGLPVQR